MAANNTSALEGQWFAAVDLGSNSFHMVVARYAHGSLQIADRLKEMVRLGEGVRDDGSLDPAVAKRALNCLARFGQRLRDIPDQNLVAVGTNAMRRIQGFDFLVLAETQLGAPIQVISGEEEARLIYHGVAHGISERGNQRLVIDIGGGSTEFVIGRDFRPSQLESLFFGCVSVTQRFFPDGKIDASRWREAKLSVAQELQRIVPSYRQASWQDVLGSSGTMRSVRDVCLAAQYSERGITADAIGQLREQLIAIGDTDELQLAGLSERRRPVFAGGTVIVDACLDELAIDQIIVADYALREGLLYNLLGQILHNDPRDGTVVGLQEKYHIDKAQAERVKAFALGLFDQVSASWELDTMARDWLAWGAQLHEIGLTISHHGYHRHGAYLIGRSDLPGFSRLEQSVIATLVGHHRRNPDPTTISALVERVQQTTRRLLTLLRLAVIFSRSRAIEATEPPRVVADVAAIRLTLGSDWAGRHPLTEADLKDEINFLAVLDIDLKLD